MVMMRRVIRGIIGSCGPKEVNKGKYVVTPLSVIEYVMQHAVHLKSVGALEITWG